MALRALVKAEKVSRAADRTSVANLYRFDVKIFIDNNYGDFDKFVLHYLTYFHKINGKGNT